MLLLSDSKFYLPFLFFASSRRGSGGSDVSQNTKTKINAEHASHESFFEKIRSSTANHLFTTDVPQKKLYILLVAFVIFMREFQISICKKKVGKVMRPRHSRESGNLLLV